jgi:amidase
MTVPQYSESWQDKAAWAQSKRTASLAKVLPKLVGVPEWDNMPQNSRDLPKEILTPREIELTEDYNITELLHLLRARDVSVEEVTRAFLRRAALAHAAVRSHLSLLMNDWMLILVRPTALPNSSGIRQSRGLDLWTLCPNPRELCSGCRSQRKSTLGWSVAKR